MWICFILITLGRVHTIASDFDLPGESDDSQTDDSLTTSTTQISPEETTAADTEVDETPTPSLDQGSYLAAILHKNFLIGAGAVVGEKWVVTTAFQMGAFKEHQLQVRVGSDSPTTGGHLVPVLRLFSHPMFQQFNNDVALLKTAEAILPSPSVALIPVAVSSTNLGDPGELITWNRSNVETAIQKIPADIVPVSECKAFYPDFELTESNICVVMDQALPFEVTLYGSPLVFNDTLVGLYMGLEANSVKPFLCSRLSPLHGWIQLTMSNETDAQRIFPLDNR